MNKWHKRFLDLAWHISTWSKDPSTQVGAVVVDNKKRVVSVGFNGFPAGVDDTFINREHKLLRTVHAEVNAVSFTHRSVEGYSIYITHPPCAHCAAILIQHGIVKICFPARRLDSEFQQRWGESFHEAQCMFNEAGVQIEVL